MPNGVGLIDTISFQKKTKKIIQATEQKIMAQPIYKEIQYLAMKNGRLVCFLSEVQ